MTCSLEWIIVLFRSISFSSTFIPWDSGWTRFDEASIQLKIYSFGQVYKLLLQHIGELKTVEPTTASHSDRGTLPQLSELRFCFKIRWNKLPRDNLRKQISSLLIYSTALGWWKRFIIKDLRRENASGQFPLILTLIEIDWVVLLNDRDGHLDEVEAFGPHRRRQRWRARHHMQDWSKENVPLLKIGRYAAMLNDLEPKQKRLCSVFPLSLTSHRLIILPNKAFLGG